MPTVQPFLGAFASAFIGTGILRRQTPKVDPVPPAPIPPAPKPRPPTPQQRAQQAAEMVGSLASSEVEKLAKRLVPHLTGPLSETPELTPTGPFRPEDLSADDAEKLARRLYPMISQKLKAELGRDRERAGMITGLHR
jgi:hypothetical protein